VARIRRYEGGDSQPTLDVARKLAIALGVSADMLVFDKDERGPDDDLKLQFEAVSRLEPEERRIIKELIEGMIIKYESRRWNKAAV
jgi:transcriptional regulator with XRE-family HTH domain